MSDFDKILATTLAKWGPEFEERIFHIPENSLMGLMMREGAFASWRREVADKRFRFHHPVRWRIRWIVRYHKRELKRLWRRLDIPREKLARKIAPWAIYPDDSDEW